MKILLVLSIFYVLVVCGNSYCDIPPKFWCDSKEIATKCNVLEACAERLWIANTGAEPVKVDLYFESLCPGCRQFLTQMLYPTWQKFKDTGILKVDLYPYGNAHEVQSSGSWNFTCQHGPDECTGNLIDNCILSHAKYDMSVAFPIIYCIESAQSPITAAKKCITMGGMDYDVINKCAMGKEGNSLMHEVALKTDALNPPHKYVPWIVLNDVHTEKIESEAQNDLSALICETYKGKKPEICTKMSYFDNLFQRSFVE